MKICPECLEETKKLIKYQGDKMCPLCKESYEEKAAIEAYEQEESYKHMEENWDFDD